MPKKMPVQNDNFDEAMFAKLLATTTPAELLTLLNSVSLTDKSKDYSEQAEDNASVLENDELQPGGLKLVKRQGGEDKGSDYSLVFRHEPSNCFVKIKAYYDSYEGLDFYNQLWFEVKATEKTITVYTKK